MMKFANIVKRFRKCESGATLVEYGIAVVLAVIVGTGALVTLAGSIDAELTSADAVFANTP